jgi:hypothetical protein
VIDSRVLPKLTAEDLKDLRFTIVGHRRLLEAIAELREPTSSTTVSDQDPVTTPASWLNRFDCRARPYLAGACLSRFTGEVLFTSGSQARGSKQFHHAAPTRSIHAICCSAALSFQGSGAARAAAISVIPGWWEAAPSITPSELSSARSRGSMSGRARSASVK